ncbi:MAG: LPS export ABC transporter ATP-binding protein [Gemmatimonadetes bacterium]|nr:LPS export ABC transporter ATP-binding protein [Gemmatimonadota bacterium]
MISAEGEALGRYLEEQVLVRLEEAGIARREPSADAWDGLCFDRDLWEAVAPERDTFQREVDRTIGELQAGRGAGRTATATTPEETGSRLWAEGLSKSYRRRKVVNGVDLEVSQGEIVGLLGPNGAGKTTTFYMIVGLIPPNAGRVHLDDRDITETPMYRRARMGVGYLAQEPSIFRKLTVEENVQAILETLKLPRKEEKARLEELLEELSIAHLRKNRAYSLSGGERRRLEITRALVQRPRFMLLDEPFAGIDPIAVNDIQQIVADLKTRSIGTVISDHNVEQTLEIVDRAYIMYEGRIRVSGTVSELVWNDEVAEIYLGPILTQRMRERYARPSAATIA